MTKLPCSSYHCFLGLSSDFEHRGSVLLKNLGGLTPEYMA
jgi:hypothetical protein